MTGGMRAIRTVIVAALVVTSATVGIAIRSGGAVADAEDVATSSVISEDNTPTHTVDSGAPAAFGQTVTVAGGERPERLGRLRGDRSFLEDGGDGGGLNDAVDDVESITGTLFGNDERLIELTVPYTDSRQSNSLSR